MFDIVGSRYRGTNKTNSDFDYVTNQDKASIIKRFLRNGPVKIVRDGEKYIKLKQNDKTYDIWILPYEFSRYYNSFRGLRTIDKGRLISLKSQIKKLGYKLGPYGVENDDRLTDIFKFLKDHPELKAKYYKYLV